ncbi:hypothetical protein DDB_G0274539 [Dictyostelium discoideum AX4]|uniref:Uncharacterized protein n=1 Tax=Dictyostelium discoideum TaxID=44689 RepID=Q86HK8_DICDI|nr:hypothetical protein DDB_G0274539 [Dictyostelium discoideum AX4]EAL70162.1 hypothetical protein DDB_G0274539 [Dictyostelium discoideum AX4]|eukprot:XP_644067.1 hypothetical protein DDB_G0274539 [Dictyostelium discoideum AX4]
MKLLYALVLLFCLIAVGYSEQIKNTNQVNNINNDIPMHSKAPWFFKQHNPEDFVKFLEEVLISVENQINPGNVTECVKTITNGTLTLVNLKPNEPRNFGIAFSTIIQITEKCGFQKLIVKFANDINYIIINGPSAFAERQLEAFKNQSTNLIDCFQKVLALSNSRELQSDQLGKCLSIVIMDPILG